MRLEGSIRFAFALAMATLLITGCSDRDTSSLEPAPPNTDPIVFSDNFGAGVDYQAFFGSKLDAVSIDDGESAEGSASLRITVPDEDDPEGGWAGGTFVTSLARQLTGYNALTFWAKSSVSSTLNVAGLGNDNTGTSKYEALWRDIQLTTTWTKYVIPIPLPEKLSSERGLFFFAEAPESATGHILWFDEVKFESVSTITNPRPSMASQSRDAFVGAAFGVEDTRVVFNVGGADQTIEHLPAYFTYASSDEGVVTVTDGLIEVIGVGSTIITAALGDVEVSGEVTVNASAPPATSAPPPTIHPSDVISLFSNVYDDVLVDTWSANWDIADVSDLKIGADDIKVYTNLVYAGIEFVTETIDATAMTHLHLDVWAPEGTTFKVKLVDFGADGTWGGAPDSEHELTFNAGSEPPFTTGTWVGLEIPLSRFSSLMSREHLAQLLLSGDVGTVFVDNIYFHR